MKNKKWALITGASAGIGTEFAMQLAAKGWSIVLVARREDRLNEIKSKITQSHDVECHFIAVDLSDIEANKKIFNYCKANSIDVSMLVNNAGYGVPGDFDANDWATHNDMLQVMLSSLVELCHLFYPRMKQQKSGFIINVASLAGLTPPTAGHTLYGAVKSFVIKFSHSLHLEGVDNNVHVTALCPGFTYTEFHDVNGTRSMVSQMSKKMWMSATDVVSQGINAVENNQAVYVNGWRNRLIARMCKYLPESLVRFLMKGSVSKFRKR